MKKIRKPKIASGGSPLSFKHYLLSQDLSESTSEHYSYYVYDFIGWLDKQDVEPENAGAKEVTAFLERLKKQGIGNSTRAIRLSAIKHYFDYQIANGKRESNPVEALKIRGQQKNTLYAVISPQELDHLYSSYTIPEEDDPMKTKNWFGSYRLSRQRNKAILGLMVWQGLRTPEINNLKVKDVKLREGKIHISGGRKGAERELELKPQQIMELMEYQLKTRPELLKHFPKQETTISEMEQKFFISAPRMGHKESVRQDSFHTWKRLSEEVAKLNPRFVNFQQVRFSVIVHWGKQYNIRKVQYMAGHKSITSTERCLLGQVEDLQNEIEKYHPIG